MKKSVLTALLLFVMGMTATAQNKPLPEAANAFLDRYFRNIAVTETKKESDGYEVRLANGMEIEFDKSGKYREVDGKGQAIPTDFIDADIVDYVTANYAGKEILSIDRKANEIDVDLSGNIELEFDGKGKFRKRD